MFNAIYKFFDRLEDRVRGWLSHRSILYGFLGGVGIVLFWRGVWHTADYIMERLMASGLPEASPGLSDSAWWDGPLSLAAGCVILLMTGVFVSNFIGNEIILSGLRGEKKLAEKTENEVKTEAGAIAEIKEELKAVTAALARLEEKQKDPSKPATP